MLTGLNPNHGRHPLLDGMRGDVEIANEKNVQGDDNKDTLDVHDEFIGLKE